VLDELRRQVLEANLEIARRDLALYTWGNASGIDRERGVIGIKPSGVPYDALTKDMIVLVNYEARTIEGRLAPSTDLATHIELYRAFPSITGVAHTHSPFACAWAQAGREILCLGTTHADHFHGPVPITEPLDESEIMDGYEVAIGRSIVKRFRQLDPTAIPGVLCANHGPFTWGTTPSKAVYHSAVLEECAKMAMWTLALSPATPPLDRALLDRHYMRKHGPGAYYGQGGTT
jgi:L-ribulose-5-phosphate 4-epimerase